MIFNWLKKEKPNSAKLSVLLIATNEAELMAQWFRYVSLINPFEMVIVDGGSKDHTLEIINSHRDKLNIKLFQRPMGDSFSEQRNFAKSHCRGDWILAIDADETLTDNSFNIIPKLMTDHSTLAFSFPRVILFPDNQHFLGHPNGDLQLRLFRNLPEIEYVHKVHERPAYKGKVIHPGLILTRQGLKWCRIKKEIKILHWGYIKSKTALLEKGRRWQAFKKESAKMGEIIGGEDSFILDAKKVNPRPIEALK